MAILIKGMEMPDSCFLCRFCRRQEYGEYVGEDTAWSCVASKKRITDGQDLIATFKHPDCPLVEAAEVKDAVSRQAAIDAECEVCRIAPKKERGHNCTYYVHGCKEIECLRALPSVQPDWNELLVICDNCGHAIHVKKGEGEANDTPTRSQYRRMKEQRGEQE